MTYTFAIIFALSFTILEEHAQARSARRKRRDL